MNIESKHILALILLIAFGSAGFFGTLISQRIRDLALFGFTVGAIILEKLDVTFLGTYWYRGTSRGIEISAFDIIPLCLLIATLLVPRYPRGRFYWPASFGLLLIYFGYCGVSVWRSEPQLYGIWELTKIVRGLLVFLAAALFIRTRRELAIVVAALTLAVWIQAANGVEQRFLKGAFRVPGTMDHENTLSTYLCMVGPVLMAATLANWSKALRWFAGIGCVLAAGTELMTLSRLGVPVFGLVVGATAVVCTSWKLTPQKIIIVVTTVLCAAGLLFVSWGSLSARYAQTNIQTELLGEHHAVETRGVYWRLAMAILDDHRYGVGLNNWSYYVSKTYGPQLGYAYTDYDDIKWTPEKADARQIFLAPAADSLPALTLGELGVAGLVILLLIWLRWFQMGATFLRGRLNPDPMHRLAIGFMFGALGISLQSITEWTYRQTPVMFTCHVMMGALASLYYARRHALATEKPADDESGVIDVEALPWSAVRSAK